MDKSKLEKLNGGLGLWQCFFGEGNQSTPKKLPTCRKSEKLITKCTYVPRPSGIQTHNISAW
jgi:hypothetical protein